MGEGEYLLDNRAQDAEERFGALAAIFNPVTFRHVEALGIAPGWRCWEVGAGGPTVPEWLADRTGSDGYVLATDLDVSWMDAGGSTFEARRHDVAQDDPPEGPFDLVHARLVLVHVPGRDEALRRMVSTLRPGGWLLVEDFDVALQPLGSPDEVGPEQELANKIRLGFRELLAARGVDLEYGRKLPRLFREAGLEEVAADAYFPVGLEACGALEHANINQVREGMLGAGLATADEIERHLAAARSGAIDLVTPPLFSTWGRRRG